MGLFLGIQLGGSCVDVGDFKFGVFFPERCDEPLPAPVCRKKWEINLYTPSTTSVPRTGASALKNVLLEKPDTETQTTKESRHFRRNSAPEHSFLGKCTLFIGVQMQSMKPHQADEDHPKRAVLSN